MEVVERAGKWTDQERLEFLLDAARRLGSTLDVAKIYASLQQLIAASMPLDGLIVSSFDQPAHKITCEFVWSDGQVLDCSGFPPVDWKPDGAGMQSQVIRTRKAEIFDVGRKVREPNTSYVQVSPSGGPAAVEDEPAAKTAMMAPMLLEGEVTGVVQAMSDRPNAYSAEDLAVFEGIALLLAPAWHNARTYEWARHERRITNRILETSPDIIYIFNLTTGKLEFTSRQLERMLGYDDADVAGMTDHTLEELMHPDDAARLPQLLARYHAAKDTDLFESEWRVRAKSGEWRWLYNRARVFERDEEGRATKILGSATDVTDRKTAEAEHKKSLERYRFLAESGPCMVWTADANGAVDYVNGRWREFFGRDFEGASDEERGLILHADDREEIRGAWRGAIGKAEEFECEARLRRHDGEYRWHICRAAPILDESGGVVHWLGMSFDIDNQKQEEAELEARVATRTAELQEAVKELEGFTYTVSHDLRGPLRAISAASMIIREDFGDSLPEEAHHHLQRQANAAKKMGTLIDDLLKLSRIGRQELVPAEFDLSKLATEVGDELSLGNRLVVEPGMRAIGDQRLIRLVLQNLLDNAAKFSPADSTITVGKWKDAFVVADHGIGFEMDYAHKIFRPFERLVREEEYPGTGIGLANVHRIIARHGGRIWAESEPGDGARFYFTLPPRR